MRSRLHCRLRPLAAVRPHGHSHSGGCGHGHSHGHLHLHEEIHAGHRLECRRVTVVGGVMNVGMALAKIALGSAGGSFALLADGAHSVVDFVADIVSYGAVSVTSLKFARCRFPFGVGRLETAGAIIVSIIMLAGGLLLTYASGRQLAVHLGVLEQPRESCGGHHDDHGHSHGHEGSHGHSHFELMGTDAAGARRVLWEMVAVAAVSLVMKEWLFRWTKRVGERAHSRVVVANAYHHRADAWSSGVALVGVGGHLIGLPMLDSVAGLIVSLSISKIGWDLLRGSALEFFDYQFSSDMCNLHSSVADVVARLSPPVVNIFATRHGHEHILHCTIVVSPTTTAVQSANATQALLAAARRSIRVSEVYNNFLMVALAQDKDTLLSNAQRVEAFREAVKEVERFHDISVTIVTVDDAVSSDGNLVCHVTMVDAQGHDIRDNGCATDVQHVARACSLTLRF